MTFWQKYKWKLTYVVLNSLLFVVCLSRAALTSETDQALNLADSLLNPQSYEESITEYKRFIFFNPEDKRISYAFYKMGLAYRVQRNWTKAVDALRASIRTAVSDSLRDERRITLGTTLIASGDYSLVQLELLKVSQFSRYPSNRLRALYFQGVAYLYTFNWESARQAFKTFYSKGGQQACSEEGKKVDALLVEAQRLPYKSAKVAKMLSTILPGAGQIYGGDWRNGLNALALNSLTATFLLRAILQRRQQDALMIFSFVFERYYLGNRYHAAEIIEDYNQSLSRQHAKKILQVLLEGQPNR